MVATLALTAPVAALAADFTAPVLTPELLSGYVAQQDPATFRVAGLGTDALNAATVLAGAAVPAATPALTDGILANYVRNGFATTKDKLATVEEERSCLARAVYHEARGEPEAGQWAVAQVILNRVASPRYPVTVCGVVYQNASSVNRCQFSFACDGRPDSGGDGNRIVRESWVKANLIAMAAYRQFQTGGGSTEVPAEVLFYHAKTVNPSWASRLDAVAEIGGHIVYAAI